MMKNPPHPGELLREDVLAPLGLSVNHSRSSPSLPMQTLPKRRQRPRRL